MTGDLVRTQNLHCVHAGDARQIDVHGHHIGPVCARLERAPLDGAAQLQVDLLAAARAGWVVDDDVNVREWKEVIWALTTRVGPARDTMLVENTPIDYLDFASPVSGLGSKLGLDATNKWPGETQREWGHTISRDADVQQRMDGIFAGLGL